MLLPVWVCVCVCVWVWALLLPDADIAVKHLQRCHLAPHIKGTSHSDCVKPVDLVDLSHHHHIDSALLAAKSRLKTVFFLCERKHTSWEQKSYSKSTQSTWGHSVSQIGSSCCCHITDIRNKWGCSVPNVQTCEFNQVRRRLWLETHAAFLSYDSITRLFSSSVKGGRPSPDCTLSSVTLLFFLVEDKVLLVTWCAASGCEFCGCFLVAQMMEPIDF